MLYQRLLTGIIGGAVYLFAVWFGGTVFSILMCLLAIIAFSELVRMRGFRMFSAPALLGFLVVLAMLLSDGLGLNISTSLPVFWLLLVLFLFLSISVVSKNRYSIPDMTYLFAGTLYIGLPFHIAVLLRGEPTLGLAVFLFVQIAIWATDTLAYFVGRALKGPKIWPAISPNKTVSGTLGGIVGAILVGLIFASMEHGKVLPWMGLAVLLSVAGQLGDFAESALKRTLNVKDSGSMLPGHGGVLDRFDSFLFAAPIAYYGTLYLSHWLSI